MWKEACTVSCVSGTKTSSSGRTRCWPLYSRRCPASRNQRSGVAAQKVHVLTMSIHRRSMAMNMYVHFEYHGNTFVWDKGKARSNLHKHGVAFEEAAAAFLDRKGVV